MEKQNKFRQGKEDIYVEENNFSRSFLGRILNNSPFRNLQPKWIVFLFLGIFLMLVSQLFGNKLSSSKRQAEETMTNANNTAEITSEENLELTTAMSEQLKLEKQVAKELKTILDTIYGVSNSEVVVKFNSTEKKVYEKNYETGSKQTQETDKNNGQRSIDEEQNDRKVVIVNDGTKDVPLVIETEMPKVKGVLVVAEGVDDIRIKANVVDAVARVLDVASHRVAVLAK